MDSRYWRLALFILAVVGLILGSGWLVNKFIVKKFITGGESRVYQALVSVYDEKNTDPEEDKKSSMKKGYVIGLYEENHEWSETERVSYLILKIRLTEKEAAKIIKPIEKEINTKKINQEQKDVIKESAGSYQLVKSIIGAREYRIDLDELGFSDPNVLLEKQPYGGEVFDWGAVERVKN